MSTSPTSKLARNLRYAEVELYLEEKKKEREKDVLIIRIQMAENKSAGVVSATFWSPLSTENDELSRDLRPRHRPGLPTCLRLCQDWLDESGSRIYLWLVSVTY